MILVPRPKMTWRMLAEGVGGAKTVIFSGREFQFSITAEGIDGEVGYGETRRSVSVSQGGNTKGKGRPV